MARAVIPVANFEKALAFYRDVLELELKTSSVIQREAKLAVGDDIVVLKEVKNGKLLRALSDVAFEVESAAAAAGSLKKKGLHVDNRSQHHHLGREISIRDPDGHIVILFERA